MTVVLIKTSSAFSLIGRPQPDKMAASLSSFRNDDGDGNENIKTGIAKQQVCSYIRLFCTFLCRYCTTMTTWKCLISRFMEDLNKRQWNFLPLSKLECGSQETNSRKLAYIRLFQRTGINATKFEKTLIQFKSHEKWRFRCRRRHRC